jgi:hypothetical protein
MSMKFSALDLHWNAMGEFQRARARDVGQMAASE